MKRIIALLLLFIPLLSMAQQWEVIESEPDELKGTQGGVSYCFTDDEVGGFVYYGDYQFSIFANEPNFFRIERIGDYRGAQVLVGLYDGNDKLIEKFKMWLDEVDNTVMRFLKTRNMGGMFNPVGQKGKVKKIIKHLNGKSGYVRIVTSRYDSTDFDLRISTFPIKE